MVAELILASASPRRRELLARFGLSFEVIASSIDESVRPGEQAADYVLRVARDKALAVAADHPGRPVLGADTAVVLAGDILGKPADPDDARRMLERLSGRCHQVMTAVVVVLPDQAPISRLAVTTVSMSDLPAEWMAAYVASGDPLDKAGAYGIQHSPGLWVSGLEGSYSGVIGLPLFETGELLRAAGLLSPGHI